MTGWRIGYIASVNNDIVTAIKNLQSHSTSNPASISQAASLEAIKSKDCGVKEMTAEFEKRRDYIISRIDNISGLSSVTPGGAFYVFCRIDKKGLTSMEVSGRLLEEAKVSVVPGKAFGSDRHIRISFAASMDNITKGMDRIQAWLSKN